MAQNGLLYDLHDKPKFGQLLVFALQQVLAVIAATIAVPTILGLPMQIPAALLGAGVGTIIYLLITKFRSPVYLGSSFAFLSSLFVAMTYGFLGKIIGSVFAGLVYVVFAIIIHFAGTAWVNKLLPPVIIGPTVAIIGLSLAGNAMGDMVKASGSLDGVNIYGSYNLIGLLCGLVAFLTIIICSSQKKYKMMKLVPFVIGIAAGYVVAAIFTAIGYATDCQYLMIIDFSPIINNFVDEAGNFVGIAAILDYPDFALIEAIKELTSGKAGIEGSQFITAGGVAEVAIAFIPVAFVVFAEHIADHKNLGTIIGRDLITSGRRNRLHRGHDFRYLPQHHLRRVGRLHRYHEKRFRLHDFNCGYYVHSNILYQSAYGNSPHHSFLRNGRRVPDVVRIYRGFRIKNVQGPRP